MEAVRLILENLLLAPAMTPCEKIAPVTRAVNAELRTEEVKQQVSDVIQDPNEASSPFILPRRARLTRSSNKSWTYKRDNSSKRRVKTNIKCLKKNADVSSDSSDAALSPKSSSWARGWSVPVQVLHFHRLSEVIGAWAVWGCRAGWCPWRPETPAWCSPCWWRWWSGGTGASEYSRASWPGSSPPWTPGRPAGCAPVRCTRESSPWGERFSLSPPADPSCWGIGWSKRCWRHGCWRWSRRCRAIHGAGWSACPPSAPVIDDGTIKYYCQYGWCKSFNLYMLHPVRYS